MNKFAKPKDLSKAEEKYWKEAEDIVEEQYSKTKEPEKFWGTVTNIFKAKVEKHLDHDPFVEARKRKKKREKKEKKKSEWVGRAHRFKKVAVDREERDPFVAETGETSEWVEDLWLGPPEHHVKMYQDYHQNKGDTLSMIPMLSYDAPASDFWKGVVTGLLEAGYSREQAVEIIRSKLSRHAIVPEAEEVLRQVGSETIRKVLSNPRNREWIDNLFKELKTAGLINKAFDPAKSKESKADLTSTQVPELIKEDLVPTLERIENELGDLAKNVTQGFETGDDKHASEVELKTYREMADKLDTLLSEVKDVRNWFGDLKNTTYTDVTGEMPKSGSLRRRAPQTPAGQKTMV